MLSSSLSRALFFFIAALWYDAYLVHALEATNAPLTNSPPSNTSSAGLLESVLARSKQIERVDYTQRTGFEVAIKPFLNQRIGVDVSSFVPAGQYHPFQEFDICLNVASLISSFANSVSDSTLDRTIPFLSGSFILEKHASTSQTSLNTSEWLISKSMPLRDLPLFMSCCSTLPTKFINIRHNETATHNIDALSSFFQIRLPLDKLSKMSCGFEWIRLTDSMTTTSLFSSLGSEKENSFMYGTLSSSSLYTHLQTQEERRDESGKITNIPTAFPNIRVLKSSLDEVNTILRNRFLLPIFNPELSSSLSLHGHYHSLIAKINTAYMMDSENASFFLQAKHTSANSTERIASFSSLTNVQGYSSDDVPSTYSSSNTPSSHPSPCRCDVITSLDKVGFTVNMSVKLACDRPFLQCTTIQTSHLASAFTPEQCRISLVQVVSPFMFGDPYEQQMHEFASKQKTQFFDFIDVENMGEESRHTVLLISSSLKTETKEVKDSAELESDDIHTKPTFETSKIHPDGTESALWTYPLHTKYALPPTESQAIFDLLGFVQPLGPLNPNSSGQSWSWKYNSRDFLPIQILPPDFEVVCSTLETEKMPVKMSFPMYFQMRSYLAQDHDIDEKPSSQGSKASPLFRGYYQQKVDSEIVYLPVGRLEHFSLVAIGTAFATVGAAILLAKNLLTINFSRAKQIKIE